MDAQEPSDTRDPARGNRAPSHRPKPMPRTLYRVAAAATAVAALAVAYQLYDMASPNTFVGDMYGLIVLMRLAVLAPCVIALLVGGVMAIVGWVRRRRGLCTAGAVVIFIATVPILGMAGQVAWDRHQNAVRAAYPDRSVEDLLRLATEEHDRFAVDALGAKGGPAAVPGLRAILLDAKRPIHLRTCAAQALANIGGPSARQALEKAGDRVTEPSVKRQIGYALENLNAAGEAGEGP